MDREYGMRTHSNINWSTDEMGEEEEEEIVREQPNTWISLFK